MAVKRARLKNRYDTHRNSIHQLASSFVRAEYRSTVKYIVSSLKIIWRKDCNHWNTECSRFRPLATHSDKRFRRWSLVYGSGTQAETTVLPGKPDGVRREARVWLDRAVHVRMTVGWKTDWRCRHLLRGRWPGTADRLVPEGLRRKQTRADPIPAAPAEEELDLTPSGRRLWCGWPNAGGGLAHRRLGRGRQADRRCQDSEGAARTPQGIIIATWGKTSPHHTPTRKYQRQVMGI